LDSIRTLYLHIHTEEWNEHLKDLKSDEEKYEAFQKKFVLPKEALTLAEPAEIDKPGTGTGNNDE
jgi:hypothetical protein